VIVHVGRFRSSKRREFWGVVEDGFARPLDVECSTTGDFLSSASEDLKQLKDLASEEKIVLSEIEVLSPITKPCRVICQGKNYLDHLLDTGTRQKDKKYNMFFNKSSASISDPCLPIVRPLGVRLLDYEVELGLVIRAQISRSIDVDSSQLTTYVGGIVMANDVSARDVQLPQSQFFKGKSYRTFCPIGPFMAIFDEEETECVANLNVELSVNGSVRQSASTSSMIYSPAETISELSRFSDLYPGDVILTGTPKGTALSTKKGFRSWFIGQLSESKRWEIFVRDQQKSGRYLNPGDVVESRIFSSDGRISLGLQRNVVVDEEEAY